MKDFLHKIGEGIMRIRQKLLNLTALNKEEQERVQRHRKKGIADITEEKQRHCMQAIMNAMGCERNKLEMPVTQSYSARTRLENQYMSMEEYYNFCSVIGIAPLPVYDDRYRGLQTYLGNTLYAIEQAGDKSFESFLDAIGSFVSILGDRNIGYREPGGRNNWIRKDWTRDDWVSLVNSVLLKNGVPSELVCEEQGKAYYRSTDGPVFEDEVEVIDWLKDYPQAEKLWKQARKNMATGSPEEVSNTADSFRKSLEAFFQQFFKHPKKSLENMKGEYGSYLKRCGVSTELSESFQAQLRAYTAFNNHNAKHGDAVSPEALRIYSGADHADHAPAHCPSTQSSGRFSSKHKITD